MYAPATWSWNSYHQLYIHRQQWMWPHDELTIIDKIVQFIIEENTLDDIILYPNPNDGYSDYQI